MNALECLNAPFCARLALSLAHFLWEGAAIALAAWGAAAALRRHSSRARYGVHCLALGAMVCALAATILLVEPPQRWETAALRISQREESGSIAFAQRPKEERDLAAGSFAGPRSVLPEENTGVFPQGAGREMKSRWESLSAPLTRWWGTAWPVCAPYVSGAYLAGLLAMMLRLVAGLGGSGRLRRLSQPVDDASILQSLARQAQALGLNFTPPIAFCRRAVVPTVVGILRPTILLPFTFATGLSADQIEMLLAHELAHVRRYDPLVNVAQRLIEALLFFHPAMWFISRRIRIERELCCDDLVVELGGKPLEYASSLVETASRGRPSARPAFLSAEGLNAAASAAQLKSRVKRLLGAPEHEALRISRAWVVFCCIAAVALLAGILSSGRAPAGETPPFSGGKTAPDSGGWSKETAGLVFRITPQKGEMFADEDLVVALEMRNVSKDDIWVRDPKRMNKAEQSLTFRPFLLVEGQKRSLDPGYPLEPIWRPSHYSCLAPGETLSGTIGFPVKVHLPKGGRSPLTPGQQKVVFEVLMGRPGTSWHPGEKPPPADWWKPNDPILAKLWGTGLERGPWPLIGPVEVRVVERPLEWHVDQMCKGVFRYSEAILPRLPNLPKERRLELLERMKQNEKGREFSDVYTAMAMSGIPEANDYLVARGREAAKTVVHRNFNAAYYALRSVLDPLSDHPQSRDAAFYREIAGIPRATAQTDDIQLSALKALATLYEPEDRDLLRRFLTLQDRAAQICSSIAAGLGKSNRIEAFILLGDVARLATSEEDGKPDRGLIEFIFDSGFRPLARSLSDRGVLNPEEFIRIGGLRALEPVIGLIDRWDASVLRESPETLRMLTGQDYGEDWGKWKEWLAARMRQEGEPAGKDPVSSGSLTNPLPDDTAWGEAVDGIRCALAPLRSGFTAGEDIALDLVYLNASNQPITVCVHPDPFFIWTFLEIRNERGQLVARGPHANGLRRGLILSDFVTLAPGETASVRYDLPRWRMGRPQLKPGTYLASAELNKINRMEKYIRGYEAFCRENGLKPWTGLIGSGPAKLTIVPMPEIAWGETVEGLQAGVGAPETTATSITLSVFLRNTRNDDKHYFDGAMFDLEMDGRPYAHCQWALMNGWQEVVYPGQIRGPIRLLLSDYVAEADRDNPRTAPRPLANLTPGRHRIRVTYVGMNGQPRIAAPEQVVTFPKGGSGPVEVEVGAPADPVTTDTLKAALAGIRARKTLLESKPLRIEYTRTYKYFRPPATFPCVLLAHNGSYKETEKRSGGEEIDRYSYRGFRVEIHRNAGVKGKETDPTETGSMNNAAKRSSEFRLGDGTSGPGPVNIHTYSLVHWVDETIGREISVEIAGHWRSSLENLEKAMAKSLPNSRFEEVGGIRCLRFAEPVEPGADFYAPELGWALVASDRATLKARDFATAQGFSLPMRMERDAEIIEVQKVEVLDDPAKTDADLTPPSIQPDGVDVTLYTPQWNPTVTTKEGYAKADGISYTIDSITWRKDLSPRENRIFIAAASEFYLPALVKVLKTNCPVPYYDVKRDLVVWARFDRDLGYNVVMHEGDTLPEEFGKAPWAVSLDPRVITNPDGPNTPAEPNKENPSGPDIAWGEAVEGLQLRLRAEKGVWAAGEIPRLKMEVRNVGTQTWAANVYIPPDLQIDGRWYRRMALFNITASPFGPGDQLKNQVISLDPAQWAPYTEMVGTDFKQPVSLSEGRHTIRAVLRPGWPSLPPGKPKPPPEEIRVFSNPVEIEIAAGPADSEWGDAVQGLRCRWMPPKGPIPAGTAPEVSVEIENVSTEPVFFECMSEITWLISPLSWPAGGTAPKFTAAPSLGTRLATQAEVRKTFNSSKPGAADSDPTPGYFLFPPKGRLMLTCVHPWKFEKPGWHQINCLVFRFNPMDDTKRPLHEGGALFAPPVVLPVVAEGQAEPPREDPGSWPPGEWGEAVEGARIRLSSARSFLNPGGKIPHLSLDARNLGERRLSLVAKIGRLGFEPNSEDVEVELDGVWYRAPRNQPGEGRPMPFGLGNWYEDLQLRSLGEQDWRSEDGKALAFGPGEHKFRAAITVRPSRPGEGQPVRLVSNVITPGPSSDLPEPDEFREEAGSGLRSGSNGLEVELVLPAWAGTAPQLTEQNFKAKLRVRNTSKNPIKLAEQNNTSGRRNVVGDWLIGLHLDMRTLGGGIRRFSRSDDGDGYWSRIGNEPSSKEIKPGEAVEYDIQLRRLVDSSGNSLFAARDPQALRPVLELDERKYRLWRGVAMGEWVPVNTGRQPVAQLGENAPWGEAVSGVQIRLRDAKPARGDGATSPVLLLLKTEAANTGNLLLHLAENGNNCQVEVDGQWYMWFPDSDLQRIGEVKRDGDGAGRGSNLLDFGGGKRHTDLSVTIGSGHWRALPAGRAEAIAALEWGNTFRAYRDEDIGAAMRLAPGKRRIRVAYNCGSARAGQDIGSVRAVSNPVEIEVLSAASPAELPKNPLEPPYPTRMRFDGAQGFLEVPDHDRLDIGEAFTLEAWVKIHEARGECSILSKEIPWKCGWTLIAAPEGTVIEGGLVQEKIPEVSPAARIPSDPPLYTFTFAVGDGTQFHNLTVPITWRRYPWPRIEKDEWHHVAATWNKGKAAVYVDGEMTCEQTFEKAAAARVPLRIGKGSADLGRHFNGELSDIRIWSVARTAQEIRDDMRKPADRMSLGLAACWPLDDELLKTGMARDISVHTGTLNAYPFSLPLEPAFRKTQSIEWGEPVDGVRLRLRPNKTVWSIGESPMFQLDIRSDRERVLPHYGPPLDDFDVRLDGVWYRRNKSGEREESLRSVAPSPATERTLHTRIDPRNWASEDGDTTMTAWSDGVHTFQIGFVVSPAGGQNGKPLRAVSNPVEIRIMNSLAPRLPAGRQTAADPGKGPEGTLSIEASVTDFGGKTPEECLITFWKAIEPGKSDDSARAGGEEPHIWRDTATGKVWQPIQHYGGSRGVQENLAAGEYRVTAFWRQGSSAAVGVSGVLRLDGTRKTKVNLGAETGPSLRVRAVDRATRKRVEYPGLQLIRPDGLPVLRWSNDPQGIFPADGSFTFEHLAPGRYTLIAGKRARFQSEPEYIQPEGPLAIDLTQGKNASVTVEMKEARLSAEEAERRWSWSVVGTVTDENGNPVEGAVIQAHCGEGTLVLTGETKTGKDGKYVLRFGPGMHVLVPKTSQRKASLQAATISVSKDGYFERNLYRQGGLTMTDEAPPAGNAGGAQPARVVLPGKPYPLDFVLAPSASVKGRLTDGGGRPLAHEWLAIVGKETWPSGSALAAAKTGPDGEFEFRNLPVGYALWFEYSRTESGELTLGETKTPYTIPLKFTPPSPGKKATLEYSEPRNLPGIGIPVRAAQQERVQVEGDFAIGRELTLGVGGNAGDKRDVLRLGTIRFDEKDGRMKAVLKGRITSWPMGKWQASVALLDADRKALDEQRAAFENSGVIRTLPLEQDIQHEFDFGPAEKLRQSVRTFRVTLEGPEEPGIAWGEVDNRAIGIGLAYEFPQRPFKLGERAGFSLFVRNKSKSVRRLEDFVPMAGYCPTVLDARGNRINPISRMNDDVQPRTIELSPGEAFLLGTVSFAVVSPSDDSHIVLGPTCGLMPGKYLVFQEYRFIRIDGKAAGRSDKDTLRSGVLPLTVEEGFATPSP